jgi:hypothetical protein
MRWAGHVARMGEKRNLCGLLVGKPEGKRPLGRPRRRWIDNIKIDILEIGLNVVNWIGMVQDRYRWRALVNAVINLRVPKMLGNYRVAAQLVASRVVISSTELVSYYFYYYYYYYYYCCTCCCGSVDLCWALGSYQFLVCIQSW